MIRIISGLLLLAGCAWQDIRHQKIWLPLIIVFAIEAAALILCKPMAVSQYLAGVAVGLIMIGVSKVTKGGIGMGDGYLICVIGGLIGLGKVIWVVMLAFVLAAFASVFLMAVRHYGRKQTMAFVPFLLASYLICLISWR